MEEWVDRGHSLPENLFRGLKGIEEGILEHCNGLVTEIQRLNNEVHSKTETLAMVEAENRALQESLRKRAQPENPDHSQTIQGGASGITSSNANDKEPIPRRTYPSLSGLKSKYGSYDELAMEYLRLLKSHENTKDQAGQYKATLKKYERRYEKDKLELAGWRHHAEKTTVRDACMGSNYPHNLTSFPLNSNLGNEPVSICSLQRFNTHRSISNTSGPFQSAGQLREQEIDAPPQEVDKTDQPHSYYGPNLVQVKAPQKKRSASVPTSSQATESTFCGEEAGPEVNEPSQEYSDDSPIVVSSRIVKKRRAHDVARGLPAKAPRLNEGEDVESIIKIEREEMELSSSPIGLAAISYLQNNDNLDLDDITGHVETPRKLQRYREKLQCGNLQKTVSEDLRVESVERAVSLPPESSTSAQQTRNSFAEALSQLRDQHNENTDMEKHQYCDVKEEDVAEGDCNYTDPTKERILKESNQVDERAFRPSNVTRPAQQNPPVKETGRTTEKYQKVVDQTVASIAEDGVDYKRQRHHHHSRSSEIKTSKTPQPQRPLSHKILNSLLQDSPKANEQRANKVSIQVESKSFPAAEGLRTPSAASFHALRDEQSQSEPPPSTARRQVRKRPTTERVSMDEILPEDEPLRARPPSRLNLEDFRINPATNNGHAYAFNEVIRGKEQRRHHLTVCTDPACCGGQFQKMLEINGDGTSSSPLEYGEEEMSLLREYLRDDGAGTAAVNRNLTHWEKKDAAAQAERRLRRMSAREVKEALQKARVQQFAERVGKHRQPVYKRAATPPGFWRTGMPSSQELEADRQASKVLEQQKIQERWREAMKPGGKGLWLFRDE